MITKRGGGAWRSRDVSAQAVATGVSSAILGYASSIAIVISGLSRAGATPGQLASGLFVLGVVMAVLSVGLSVGLRIPVSVVWSTPGVALLAGVGPIGGGYPAVLGGLILAGVLLILTGLVAPVSRLILRLPTALTAAVLAGVVLPFCLEPAHAVADLPVRAGAIALAWALVLWWRPAWASAAALGALVVIAVLDGTGAADVSVQAVATAPQFTWQAAIQVAVPTYVVTMAAQNLVGVAVLTSLGYRPPVGRILVATGAGSVVGAGFGAPTVNLAAITGALTAGPGAHPDPARRWPAAAVSGTAHLVLAALAPVAAGLVSRTDPRLVAAAAGLALVMTLMNAAQQALAEVDTRIAATVTLLVTASGVTVLGVGAAPWGLLLGGLVLLLRIGVPRA